MPTLRRLLALVLLIAGLATPVTLPAQAATDAERVMQQAYKQHRGNFMIEIQGTVSRLLADDTQGSRHQRFLVRFSTGQVVLVAHNIDVAPRVPNLRVGQPVTLKGEYEWNAKGGAIHWTHPDPGGRHEDGWIRRPAAGR